MHRQIRILLLVVTAWMAVGCVTQKQMTYLHDADAEKAAELNARFNAQSDIIIRNGDALTIYVSALDNEAVTPYNLPTVSYERPGTNAVQTTPMMQYYTVDNEGNVTLPVLGKVHVAGLTRSEVEDVVRERLEAQVVNPSVQVHLINARVSVLGEVARPGYVSMTGDRLTLLEALAAAGDLTVYGKRENVLVTREVNGKLELTRVNLRSTDIYTSPVYYLQPNDVIYVSPNKVRAVSSTNAGIWISLVGTLASTAAVVVTIVKK